MCILSFPKWAHGWASKFWGGPGPPWPTYSYVAVSITYFSLELNKNSVKFDCFRILSIVKLLTTVRKSLSQTKEELKIRILPKGMGKK
jgi:hypothetical protein